MNTRNLSNLYSTLDATERFRLLLASAARKDELERVRLMSSAPRIQIEVAHTFVLSFPFVFLSQQFWADQFALVGTFFAASVVEGSARKPAGTKRLGTSRMLGFLLLKRDAGWRAFCMRSQFTDELIEGSLLGRDFYRLAMEIAEAGSLSDQEAEDLFRSSGPPMPAPSADDFAGQFEAEFHAFQALFVE